MHSRDEIIFLHSLKNFTIVIRKKTSSGSHDAQAQWLSHTRPPQVKSGLGIEIRTSNKIVAQNDFALLPVALLWSSVPGRYKCKVHCAFVPQLTLTFLYLSWKVSDIWDKTFVFSLHVIGTGSDHSFL